MNQQIDLVADLSEETLRKGFHDIFPEITSFLLQEAQQQFEVTPAHGSYIKKMVEYNCLGGKCNRGLMVQQTLVHTKKAQKQGVTQDELRQARVVGWCIEWLQAFFLVADDIMDQSVMRRNQPCWYKLPEVKLVACNDYIMLESHMYRLLRKYLSHDKNKYISIVDLFHDVTYQTEIGQMFDTRNQHQSTKPANEKSSSGLDFSLFTMEEYKRIVKYKTAYYSFYLPVAAGLLVAGVSDPAIYKETETLMVMMGEYFQIQDDYLDCYADPIVLGKVGRDIEEGKCSWMIVQALKRVNAQQLQILHECYGKEEPELVAKVKAVYKELDMESVFKSYESQAEQEMISFIDNSILKKQGMEVIYSFALKLIMKRNK